MGQGSKIEWTEDTWNPVAGCTAVSPGCLNCYAARMALRIEKMHAGRSEKYAGTARRAGDGRPVFTGTVNLDQDTLPLPYRWRRPRIIFVNSMSDLFHENVPLEFVQQVFGVMDECSHHTFQVLTKRPERARELAPELPWPSNVWLGTSVESQRYTTRISLLCETPAQTKFLSCEPLLGPLLDLPLDEVDWVIVGGESGPRARSMNPEWATEIRDRCLQLGVPFFFKQWGGTNKKRTGRLLEGRTWDGMPQAARVTSDAQSR